MLWTVFLGQHVLPLEVLTLSRQKVSWGNGRLKSFERQQRTEVTNGCPQNWRVRQEDTETCAIGVEAQEQKSPWAPVAPRWENLHYDCWRFSMDIFELKTPEVPILGECTPTLSWVFIHTYVLLSPYGMGRARTFVSLIVFLIVDK